MKCGKIQNLIITGYIDNEIDGRSREEIERHLEKCERCREFKKALCQAAIDPFRSSRKLNPPESVWRHIKATIAEEERQEGFLAGLAAALRNFFRTRKLVYVTVAVMAMALISAIIAGPSLSERKAVGSYLEEQIAFLSYLESDEANGGLLLGYYADRG